MANLTIGDRITLLRKKAELTQTGLAERLFISNKTVSKWESNVGVPSLEMIQALSQLFNCSIDYLLNGKEWHENNKSDEIKLIIGYNELNLPVSKTIPELGNCIVTGRVGCGKTDFLNHIITQSITNYSPSEIQFVLMDDSRVHFCDYKKIPHLYTSVMSENEEIETFIKKYEQVCKERLEIITKNNCSNIEEYNFIHKENKLPYILNMINALSFWGIKKYIKENFNLMKLYKLCGIYLYIAPYKIDQNFHTINKGIFTTQIAFEETEENPYSIYGPTIPFNDNVKNKTGTFRYVSTKDGQINILHNEYCDPDFINNCVSISLKKNK